MPGSDLREPHNGGDVHVGSGIRFLFSIECSHMSNALDFNGSRNTWSCLFWLGPSSSEMTILKTSHVAPRIGLEIPRPSGGELLRWVPRLHLGLEWTQVVLTLPLLFGDRSLSSLPLCGNLSLSLRLLGLQSRIFSSLLFSFRAKELPCLDIRASSPLMYFSTLASM